MLENLAIRQIQKNKQKTLTILVVKMIWKPQTKFPNISVNLLNHTL